MKIRDVVIKLRDAALGRKGEGDSFPHKGNYLIRFFGLTRTSKKALLGRDLTVRHFPFTIGRAQHDSGFSKDEPDFVLHDTEPLRISRVQLSIESEDDRIVLADKKSRLGSLVNGELLGENAGGRGRVPLRPGRNEVILGGRFSPFVFEIEVQRAGENGASEDYVTWGEHVIPVAAQYIRICLAAKEAIYPSYLGAQARVALAMSLSAGMARDPEMTEMLYCYAAHPETFSDGIVAHSVNVAIYAVRLATCMSLPMEFTVMIGAAALLHDIGMYAVPREIVYKPGKISRVEFEAMKKHTMIGYEALSECRDGMALIPMAAHEHHERVDGSGYPGGKKALAEGVELLGLVDVFEAITHHRPQRGPVTPHQAMQMLLSRKHEAFSPGLLKAFMDVFSFFPVFSVVRLNSGEIGQVVRSNSRSFLRPVVRLLLDRHGEPLAGKKAIDLAEDDRLFITKDISDRVFIDNYFKL
ncbi:MAG: HD domain-containing phosphohydrolase [Thermodesulfobacteriota bacterium]